MFDFNALLAFLKELFSALMELVNKMGIKIGEEETAARV